MEVSIRKFVFDDIPNKVKWINDPMNNKYLHYDLPLEQNKTEKWFENNKDNSNRFDAVIEVNNEPVGIIGLVNIDYNKNQGEYYITIGKRNFAGKGIAYNASLELLKYAFEKLNLSKVYLFTEQENIGMRKLASRLGMLKESLLLNHSDRNGQLYNAYYYSILHKDFEKGIKFPSEILSDIEYIDSDDKNNNFFMKRDDLISFSFGGNKARKAKYFFKEIIEEEYQVVVTYGSKFSNHCRVIANLCAKYGLKCVIVSPFGSDENNFNRKLIEVTNARIIECEISEVSDTIDRVLKEENLKTNHKAYFIPGGGHGNLGTQAYVDAYHEIEIWSRKNNVNFDFIFLASGTGTTQAGLILGNEFHGNKTKVIGISVGREKRYATDVINESIHEYIKNNEVNIETFNNKIYFYDQLVSKTYGQSSLEINNNIINIYKKFGIALSASYTGKLFTGMENFIKENDIANKNILFLNSGGVPLFFDDLNKIES